MTALSEKALSSELGLGVQPIRDAIKRLELEHLVSVFPRRGTFVAELGMRDARLIDEMRLGLEILCAELAAVRASADEREELVRLAEANKTAVGREAIVGDTALHRHLYAMAHNHFLEAALNQHLNLALRVWYYSDQEMSLPIDSLEADQTALAYAVRDRDPQAARAAMTLHISKNSSGLQDAIEQDSFNFRP